MEALATSTHLIPEQTWDEPSRPEVNLQNGKPTGSAVPLLWAHAEYIKLLRSSRDGKVFDRIDVVADRYQKETADRYHGYDLVFPLSQQPGCSRKHAPHNRQPQFPTAIFKRRMGLRWGATIAKHSLEC